MTDGMQRLGMECASAEEVLPVADAVVIADQARSRAPRVERPVAGFMWEADGFADVDCAVLGKWGVIESGTSGLCSSGLPPIGCNN